MKVRRNLTLTTISLSQLLLNYFPIDRGEMLSLRQLLVQSPEDLHDAEGRRCDGI